MTTHCNYILGPCVDGTQAGRRCTSPAIANTVRCGRHTYDSGAGRREAGEDFAYAVEDDSEWASEDEWV